MCMKERERETWLGPEMEFKPIQECLMNKGHHEEELI